MEEQQPQAQPEEKEKDTEHTVKAEDLGIQDKPHFGKVGGEPLDDNDDGGTRKEDGSSKKASRPFNSAPTRPWKCPVCGWYLAIPKSEGCPYCLNSIAPPSRDKSRYLLPNAKEREPDAPLSQRRLVNVWNVGQSQSTHLKQRCPPHPFNLLSFSFSPLLKRHGFAMAVN